MTRDEINSTLDVIIKDNAFLPFDAATYYQVLTDNLASQTFELPESTRGILLSMAAGFKNQIDRLNTTFTVVVTFVDGFYTAECDALHLVTEAPTFDALTHLTWDIVPELIELNALALDPDLVRLRFDVVQSTPALRAH